MKLAVVGCAHGELETIYATLEKQQNVKVDLLLCCGDFQALRNEYDGMCMASKKMAMGSFYKYYSGEKVAPVLTIFIGGNHEASNYLQELPFGGWVAPNIYYLGSAGCISVGGIRIAGISGIYKKYDYRKDRFEFPPYTEHSKRSVYHIRKLEIFRLKQLSNKMDICLTHDWPLNIDKFGDVNQLIEMRPNLREDIDNNKLGSPPTKEILQKLQPLYWFSAHLHTYYSAVVSHENSILKTKFIALDKCCPEETNETKFWEIVDIPNNDQQVDMQLSYDLEWLAVLYLTKNLKSSTIDVRVNFTPTKEDMDLILEKFDNNLIIPMNFCRTVQPYDPLLKQQFPSHHKFQFNPQTKLFCATLGVNPLDVYPINRSV